MKKEPFKCGIFNVNFITKESNKDWRAYQNSSFECFICNANFIKEYLHKLHSNKIENKCIETVHERNKVQSVEFTWKKLMVARKILF